MAVTAADMDVLERLLALKAKGIVTEAEFNLKKHAILSQETSQPPQQIAQEPEERRIAQGVSLVVGSALLFLICSALLSDEHSSQDQLNEALGFLIMFGVWIVPHSIWLISRDSANRVLPIVSLVAFGFCCLVYVGSL